MKSLAKLIYQTCATYRPTAFPAHYYGMPNGKIYLVFSRFYKGGFNSSGLEFVFAEHNDFSFDYESETIVSKQENTNKKQIFAEQVDSPNTKFNIFSINRKLRSYAEAFSFLNKEAYKMKKSH